MKSINNLVISIIKAVSSPKIAIGVVIRYFNLWPAMLILHANLVGSLYACYRMHFYIVNLHEYLL